MGALPGNAVNWIAGAIVAGGVVWAGTMYLSPRQSGPDVAGLQALAERLARQQGPSLGDRSAGGRRAASDEPDMIAMPRVDYAALRRAKRRLAGHSEPEPAPQPVREVAAAPAPAAPAPDPTPEEEGEEALKDLALVGVTTADGKESALLVHLESQERQSIGVGETILGFKVKEIQPEAVVLAKGNKDVTLKLGDHDMAQASAKSDDDEDADEDENDNSPFGRWRDRGDDRDRNRFAESFGRGFGDRSFSGADFRSRSNDGDSRQASSSDSNSREDRSDQGNRTFGNSGFGTPVFGGFGGFGGFGTGNRQGSGSTSTFAAGTSGSSTNPQTARRRGATSSGDTASKPVPISNPQTERRRGTTSQPAFGENDTTVRSQGSNTARSR